MTFSPLLPFFEHSRLKYYALAMASSNPWDHDVAKSTGKPATPSTRPRSRADDWPSTPPGPSEPFPSLPPSRRSTGVLQRRAIRVRRAPRLLLLGGRVFRLAGVDGGAWYSGDRPRFCHDRAHSISTVDRVRATVRSGQRTGDDGHSGPCESAFCEWSFTC
jgi:hypothetical protein